MANQPDTSDDLIAELAKLMATNAKGDASGPKAATPTAPTTPSPALQGLAGTGAKPSIRIPGLDMPPLSVVPIDSAPKGGAKPQAFEYRPMTPPASQTKPGTTVPSIRIPGMDQPVPTAAPVPAPAMAHASAAPMQAAPKPVAAPVVLSPVAPSTKPLVAAPEIRHVELKAVPPVASLRPGNADARIEPKIAAPVAPPPAALKEAKPTVTEPTRRDHPPISEFDFGFGTNDKAKDQEKGAPKVSYDPIADIIAAEQKSSGVDAKAAPFVSKPVEISASAPKPATVTPMVPRPAQSGPAPAGKLAPATPMTLKPSFGAKPVPPENDKFFVAPVFGLGAKAAAPAAPPAESKPMQPAARRSGENIDEIENLIGEAVRVEMSGETAADRPEPAKPVVPPLNTNFAPRRTGLKDESPPHSADAAILAAAAVSGAEVGRIDPILGEEPPRKRGKYKPKPARRPSSGARQYVGLAVAGTLLLAAGFGLYWVLNMGRGDPSSAPLLTADASPTKEVPAVVASTEPKSPVLDQIDGVVASPDDETLVSRDDTEGETVTDVAAVPEVTESGLANRKVRTVTVRPDGTIVSSDDAVAGTEALPVERPDVPDVPGQPLNPSDLLTAAANTVSPDPIATVIAESGGTNTDPAPTAPIADPAAPQTDVAAADPTAAESIDVATATPTPEPSPITALALTAEGATATPPGTIAPVPMSRPLDREQLHGNPSQSVTAAVDPNGGLALTTGGQQIDLLAPQPEQVAVATPQPEPAADAAAYVQLSAQRDEATAKADARSFKARFSSLFAGGDVEIHRVDLGAKGTWYRVLVPASSKAAANSICGDIKNAGGDCLIR